MTPTPASAAEVVVREWPKDTRLGYIKVEGISEKTLARAAEEHNALARAYTIRVAQLANAMGDLTIANLRLCAAHKEIEAAEARATASDALAAKFEDAAHRQERRSDACEASRAAMRDVMRDAAKSIRRVLDANPDAYRHGQAELLAAAQWLSAGAQPGEDGNG